MSRKPNFLIMGASKCGTSSLAANLGRHPDVHMPGRGESEPHYFTKRLGRGPEWYLSLFSCQARMNGEKSPTYLYCLESHHRIHSFLPEAKLIVMIRNPVLRAYSNWNMRYNDGRLIRMGLGFNSRHTGPHSLTSLDFEALVDYYLEHACGGGPVPPRLREKPLDIIGRSLYWPQINSLLNYYPPENILLLISERYFADEKKGYAEVCGFLGLDPITSESFEKRRIGVYGSPVPAGAAARLWEYYRPFNEKLFRFMGKQVPEWDAPDSSGEV